MRIETERLTIYPIDDKEIERLIENEKDPGLKQAYTEMLRGCAREPEKRMWHAPWVMELTSEPGTIVGDLGFKGLNANGMVDLGYGLREGFCGRGYMTEAVQAVAKWALAQPGVTRVEAETEPGNAASQKVLANSNFVPTGEIGVEGPRFLYVSK